MAPDVFNHAAVPEQQHGIDRFRHVINWVREFSSDVHYDIDDIISEGEKVAVRMTQSGTHTGTVRGIPPLANVFRSTTSIGFVLRTERSQSYGP
jgi:predicted ester cyclase